MEKPERVASAFRSPHSLRPCPDGVERTLVAAPRRARPRPPVPVKMTCCHLLNCPNLSGRVHSDSAEGGNRPLVGRHDVREAVRPPRSRAAFPFLRLRVQHVAPQVIALPRSP